MLVYLLGLISFLAAGNQQFIKKWVHSRDHAAFSLPAYALVPILSFLHHSHPKNPALICEPGGRLSLGHLLLKDNRSVFAPILYTKRLRRYLMPRFFLALASFSFSWPNRGRGKGARRGTRDDSLNSKRSIIQEDPVYSKRQHILS